MEQYGLVNDLAIKMLQAIDNLAFGDALKVLMSKKFSNYSFKRLEATTGLDKTTISSMLKGSGLTKLNVISACLGIHLPSMVTKKMLKLAEINLDLDLQENRSVDNMTYNRLIHLKWATDYSDIIEELKPVGLDYLISNPHSKK